MIIIKSNLNLKCDKCGASFDVDKNRLEMNVISNERSMGEELLYNYYENVSCECGNEIHIEINGYEYPFGILNHEEFEIWGGQYIYSPVLSISLMQ